MRRMTTYDEVMTVLFLITATGEDPDPCFGETMTHEVLWQITLIITQTAAGNEHVFPNTTSG